MSLPVSHYEALLAEVRGLRRKTERVQQLAQPLIVGTRLQRFQNDSPLDYTMESLLAKRQHNASDNSPNYDQRSSGSEQDRVSSEDECRLRDRASRSQMSVSSEPVPNQTPIDSMYHGAWPNVPRTLWNSEPASLGKTSQSRKNSNAFDGGYQNEVASVMSFASSSGGAPIDSALCNAGQKWSSQQLEAKMDVVNSLLSMLGSQEHVDMGETLLALSTCQESCLAMRQSGCIPLLVQLVQSDKDNDTRKKAAHALHNLVNSQPDEQIRKRELRILKLLEDVRQYIECLKYNMDFQSTTLEPGTSSPEDDGDRHPVQTIAHLMKLSFDESHRQAICLLGGIYTTATLVETEHTLHGNAMQNGNCILMRRYACMTLTNLTFGDSGNKTLLCSFKEFMRNLVQQLQSPSDELRQVTASVLRNLSWRADSTSKEILREVGSVTGLMKAAMIRNKENTLKSILSALWNLSAHCTENKSEICGVEGGLGFIVNMLTYKTPSKSLAIIENAGGILRNISSQIAVRDDYREILRHHNCLHILLEQLKSPSLTIVSNACGTLWNLSAKNAQDQDALWQMGAPAMLRSLNHSKHKMIAMGSSAALKNLISCRPQQSLAQKMDSTALALNLPELPTLGARKQKALLQDLDQNLSETYENIDKDSPVKSNATTRVAGFLPGNRATLSSPERFVNAFASLNLNEPSTSYGTEFKHKSKIPQNFGNCPSGGSSLPYVPQSSRRSNPASFLPVRTKFADHSYEDDTPEQPIDYSQKYSETTVEKKRNPIGASSDPGQTDKSLVYPDQKDGNFAMGYTETDLDQPTDYSLRYADDDSYSDICGKITKQEFVQDTVKTYCTEGTPYETPFVFSNATSMSDLRNIGNMDEKPEIDNDIQKDLDKKDNKETKHVDEKDRCSTEDISEMENTAGKPQKSEFSSGMMSPEKPVNYCEEGTPGYFSRVSSFSSDLDSIQVKQEANLDASIGLEQKAPSESRDKVSTTPKTPNEAKVVKFEQVVNYAEQTPLMFSRSSSLASLDSIEQHSIHDDRSSVVSDFSRLTSGIVSPSELPDSPTQTVPSSPRSSKGKLGFPHSSKQLRDNKQRLPQKSSVFEDNTTKFKEENTPIQFSTATSLSSLTIDDHEDPGNGSSSTKTPDTKVLQPPERRPCLGAECGMFDQQGDQPEKKDIEKENRCEESSDLDDDLLAACINDGIQSNISAPTASTAPTMLPMPSYKYQHMKMPGGTGIPLMRRTPPRHLPSAFPGDAPRTYCTEDTPAELSRAGSRSNLSTLSIPNDAKSKVGDFSDDSSNLDEESEQLLAECIQMGMPQPVSEIKGCSSSLGVTQDNKSKTGDLSDDSSVLSEDNEKLLQECIESGMPKPKPEFRSYHSSLNSVLTCKPNRIKSGDISDDSCSNISVDSEKLLQECIESAMPKHKGFKPNLNIDDSKSKSDNSSDDSDGERLLQECIELGMPPPKSEPQFSGFRSSLSGRPVSNKCGNLSDDSGSSLTTDQEAMLQECIKAGMPQQKRGTEVPSANRTPASLAAETCLKMKQGALPRNPEGNALKQMLRPPQVSALAARPVPNVERRHEKNELPRGTDPVSRSKNVNAASVAESTAETPLLVIDQRPKMSIQAAGVEKSVAQDRIDTEKCDSSDPQAMDHSLSQLEDVKPEIQLPASDTLPASISATEETPLTDQTKSGSSKSGSQFLEASFENDFTFSNSDNCANLNNVFNRSCEESGTLVDHRMLDPDAMIESLDRFTAELVSQASQLNKEKSNEGERQPDKSNNDDITWNEDYSQNELTFPTISGSAPNVISFDSDSVVVVDGAEGVSNDFSSVNTNTMTESTLIAIEANKMVTVFKQEAELSQSIASAKSLDLDSIMPPSQLNSLTGSVTGFEKGQPKSPKAVFRKKSLPGSLLVKRALSNSLNQGSSLESLYNSLGNIEGTKPPSEMQNLGDMESSIMSVASLPLEVLDMSSPIEKGTNWPHPIFNVKQQFAESSADLEMVNPPSIFNEITDMCNSLADVATEIIGTETSTFEDCLTHVPDDNTLPLDPTEFSDANSLTPIQSDFSSAENTPKRTSKSLSKSMMTKQRRNLARERYKTYVVAAEKVMQESIEMETKERSAAEERDSGADENLSDDYQTVNDKTAVFDSLTYTVKSGKITPKERRKMDRARFETRVLDESSVNVAKVEQSPDSRASSASPSPTRSKLSIRRNFMQKRLENKERFRTQTVSESSFGSPELSTGSPPCESHDLHSLVEQEANLVLKNIRDSKCLQDEMLDFETLSLLSNDDDSEHNSGVAVNYNTYHKSWTLSKPNVPVVTAPTVGPSVEDSLTAALDEQPAYKELSLPDETNSSHECEEDGSKPAKSKIVKPTATEEPEPEPEPEEQPKGIRGRRKMLYSKTSAANKVGPKTIKPAKTMAVSSLVKNVTSTIKSGNAMKNVTAARAKSSPSIRPQMPSQVKSSGYGYTRSSPNRSGGNSPKHSPKATPPLERQGTFTKDDSSASNSPKSMSRLPTPPSKIPSFARQIPRAVPSKTALNNNMPSGKSNIPAKSLSADRTNKNARLYNRSTSADSRESVKKIQASSSTQSLKNEPKATNGALGKRSGIPSPAQRSHSNVSVASNGSVKKQVTSKIASLWKRVEETKARQFPTQDKRVWIHSENEPTKPSLVLENEIDETSPNFVSPNQE